MPNKQVKSQDTKPEKDESMEETKQDLQAEHSGDLKSQ